MKAILIIHCYGCERKIGEAGVDTGDIPGELQAKLNKIILAHREDCKYYSTKNIFPR